MKRMLCLVCTMMLLLLLSVSAYADLAPLPRPTPSPEAAGCLPLAPVLAAGVAVIAAAVLIASLVRRGRQK